MAENFAFGEEQLLKLAEEWEALPEVVRTELNLSDYTAKPYNYGDLQQFLNDQMSTKNLSSEDYFNMLADNL